MIRRLLPNLLMLFSMLVGSAFVPYTAGICASREHVREAKNPLTTSSPMEEEKHSESDSQFEPGEIGISEDLNTVHSDRGKLIPRPEIQIQPFGLVGDITKPPEIRS